MRGGGENGAMEAKRTSFWSFLLSTVNKKKRCSTVARCELGFHVHVVSTIPTYVPTSP
jgi:hypothetical protein